jgi:hypothetical protein
VPLRCQTLEELNGFLLSNEHICAFLIGSSFLASLDIAAQRNLIKKLSVFSTFVWLRFQEDRLIDENPAVERLIATARCRVSPSLTTEVSFQNTPDLREKELSSIGEARKRLNDGEPHGLFIPGELSTLQLNLLGAAMSQYSKMRHFNPGAQLSKVTTRFLQGGQTGATVALVRVNDLRVPVIVKLDNKDLILDEARRFLTFIHRDNPELHPEVHLHADAALIVFGVISDPRAEPEQPAPTLEQQLTQFWYGEMYDPTAANDSKDLLSGFSNAVARLANLNKQKCSNNDFPCKANPYLENLKKMEAQGFDWGFDHRAIEARCQAEDLLSTMARAAVCHGDAHMRNILIRANQGFPIDYAYSGPGHPCCDLVRLELSVYLMRFVPVGDETELTALQRDLSILRLSLKELSSKYEHWFRCKTNELCLSMCVTARDTNAEVLQAHSLTWEHYLATKLLTAWQSLQIPGLQHSLARGVISAINNR